MRKYYNIKNFYVVSIIIVCLFITRQTWMIIYHQNCEYNKIVDHVKAVRNEFVSKDFETINYSIINTITTNYKQISKLPASNILLRVESTNLDLDYVLAEQYENAISEQLTAKEAIFKTDVDEKFRNRLNLYAWRDLSSAFVEVFKGIVGFPFNPMMKDYATNLSISQESKYSHGKRIFGYLTTPVSGYYKLAVSSSKHSEIWLSTNHDPSLASKVAWVGSWEDNSETSTPINIITQLTSQQSAVLYFNADQLYYMEIMHACDAINSHVQLFWASVDANPDNGITTPNESPVFEIIEAEYFVLHHLYMDEKLIAESRPQASVWPMHKETIINSHSIPDHRIELIKLPVLKGGFLKGVIKVCDPIPKKVQARNVSRYAGMDEVKRNTLFPDDGSDNYDDNSDHSPWMDAGRADQLIMFLKHQLYRYKSTLILEELLNLEEVPYDQSGSRFLLEAKVRLDENSETVYRLSEYLFYPAGSSFFCYLPDFQWNRDAFIYMGIPIKNQGHWVRHTIENLERLQYEINDENWGLIISDFESTDMDVLALLTRSTLRNWKYVRLEGSFLKSHGINAYLNEMGGGSDIIGLSCDLHLDIPLNYFDVIRTHTIQGLAVVSPEVMRLYPGRFKSNPLGFWERFGFGEIGMYLSDWHNIGGMNTDEFGNTWGGEDSELIDRCVGEGIEVQRILIRNFYHNFHTKDGIWDSEETLSLKYYT